jgi:hypothetical protein
MKSLNGNGFREYYNVQTRMDNSGNIYVAAGYNSIDSIVNSSSIYAKHPAGFVLIKYSSAMSQTWVKTYESAYCDFKSLHVTTTGDAFVAVTEAVTNEGRNARLYKYASSNGALASNYPLNYNSGGTNNDEAFGVITDNSSGFIYLAATDSFGTSSQGIMLRRYSNVTTPVTQWTKIYNTAGTVEKGLSLIINNNEPVIVGESFNSSKNYILLSYAASTGNYNFATSIPQDANYSDVNFCQFTRSTNNDLYFGFKGLNSGNTVDGVVYKYSFGGLFLNSFTLTSNSTILDDKLRAIDLNTNVVIAMSTNNGSNFIAQKFDPSNNPLWSTPFTASNFSLTDAKSESGTQSSIYVTGTINDVSTEGIDTKIIKINTTGSQSFSQTYDNTSYTSSENSSSIIVSSSGAIGVAGLITETSSSIIKVFTLSYNNLGTQQGAKVYSDNNDNARNTVTDASGNVYVSGNSTDASNLNDIYVSKYNSAGALLWTTRIGTSLKDETTAARQLSIDNNGNLFVVGTVVNATTDVLIACVKTSNGAQKFITSFNGTGNSFDIPYSSVADGLGNVYITGETRVSGTNRNVMLLKYSSTGSQLLSVNYEGTAAGNDIGRDVTLDGTGNIYIAAESVTSSSNTADITLIKYSAAGSFAWAKSINDANGADLAGAVKVYTTDSIYIVGSKFNAAVNTDAIAALYNAAGTQTWIATFNSGTNNETANNIALNQSGAIAVSGQTNAADILIWKVNANGTQAFSQTYNGAGSGSDFERGIYINASGNVFVGGYFRNTSSVDDGILLQYDNSGSLANSIVIHLNSTNLVNSVFFDGLGKAIVIGSTNNASSTDALISSYSIPFTDLPPSISSVSNQSTCGAVVGPLSINLTDESVNTVSVTASSNNTSVISNSNIIISGTGANRTINITPTSSQTGLVTITLTATDAGSNSVNTTFTIDVKTLPVKPIITADASLSFCAGGSVNLTSSYISGNTWSTSATSNSISVSSANTITVSVNNVCGTSTSDPITTTILPQPVAQVISASTSTNICAGAAVTISGNGNGTWNTGSTNSSISASNAGAYFVVTTNSCGSVSSNIINVNVNPLPVPTITGASGFCPNSTTTLATSQTYVSYVWTGNINNASLLVNNAGTYSVSVVDNNGCSGSISVIISACVSSVPNTQLRSIDCGKINLVPSAQIACNPVAGATNYEFEFRDINTNALYATKVMTSTIIAPGNITPNLNWSTQYSCRVRAKVGGVWGVFSAACTIGMTANPALVGVGNTKLSTKWCNKTNISTTATIDCIQISMASRYEFEFVDAATSAVSIVQSPTKYLSLSTISPAIIAGHTYNVRVRAKVYTTWGNFSDVCSMAFASVARYADNNETSQLDQNKSEESSIESFDDAKLDLNIYPNPFNEGFTFQLNKLPMPNASYSIYNSVGQLMYSKTISTINVNVSADDLAAGVYFLICTNGEEVINKRVIKNNK